LNKDQFTSLLRNPANLNSESVALLSSVVKEFPYFQTAHLLYTKNLYDQNSMHYSAQLKLAAAYISDRKILYQLINSEKLTTSATVKQIEPPPVEEKPAIVEAAFRKDTIVELKPPVNNDTEKRDVAIVELVLEAPGNKEEKQIEVDIKKMSPLDQEIISKAIDASIKLEVDEPLL
jgi:hypothetical protein